MLQRSGQCVIQHIHLVGTRRAEGGPTLETAAYTETNEIRDTKVGMLQRHVRWALKQQM